MKRNLGDSTTHNSLFRSPHSIIHHPYSIFLMRKTRQRAFTIVELLIVIVIIGILATIIIVAYNGITKKAQDSVLQSDLRNASNTLEIANATNGSYPGDGSSLKASPGTSLSYDYSTGDNTYCLQATGIKTTSVYHVTNGGSIASGACVVTIVDGTDIQKITAANCPSTRVRAVDARDQHTYWVQKLADGKCWMLTNLAYSGSGNDTYGDVKILADGTSDYFNNPNSPRYYVVPSTTNYTTEPTNPSASTNGIGQYGYLYNRCAAVGSQTSTSACGSTTSPAPDTMISVCPFGWRLPIGNGGEFAALNVIVNGGSATSGSGLISNPWLGQLSGVWYSASDGSQSFMSQGIEGYYWSGSWDSGSNYNGYLMFSNLAVDTTENVLPSFGFAVRCVAAV